MRYTKRLGSRSSQCVPRLQGRADNMVEKAWKTDVLYGSSPSLRLEFELDNKGLRAVVDKRRIPRNILENKSPRSRNPAHGCLGYRSLARSARMAHDRSGHTPETAGFASRTTGDLPRVSALPDVLLPGQRASLAVPP